MQEFRECLLCKQEFEATRPWQKFCSSRCRNNYHVWFAVESDTPYIRLRYLVLNRDNFTCQKCGKTEDNGVKLVVHHKGMSKSPKKNDQISNLVTLCHQCHIEKHLGHPADTFPRQRRKPLKVKTCFHCGVEFQSSRSWAKFCSSSCRASHYRDKLQKQYEEMLRNGQAYG